MGQNQQDFPSSGGVGIWVVGLVLEGVVSSKKGKWSKIIKVSIQGTI